MEKIVQESKTDDGMKLILTDEGNGRIASHLEEDLELRKGKSLENLVKILEIITTVKKKEMNYIQGPNRGGEKKLVVELKLENIEEFIGLNEKQLQLTKLYKTVIKSLLNKMDEIQKERTSSPKTLSDDIEYFTHLGVEAFKREKKLIELTYFLRTLYGVVQADTKITMKQILSDKKNPKITKPRSIMMYILSNKFRKKYWKKDSLSSVDIGKIFGQIGHKKDHATVLLNIKKFDKKNFDPDFYKNGEPLELYLDAKKRYITPKRFQEKIK